MSTSVRFVPARCAVAVLLLLALTLAGGCRGKVFTPEPGSARYPAVPYGSVYDYKPPPPAGFEKIGTIAFISAGHNGRSEARRDIIAQAKRIGAEHGANAIVVQNVTGAGGDARNPILRIEADAGRLP